MLADNKIAENAGWDRDLLAVELGELTGLLDAEGLDISLTGFDAAEIDALAADLDDEAEPDDQVPAVGDPAVEKGDLWLLGRHRLICADARGEAAIAELMDGAQAQMVFIDPPYNVPVLGHVQGRGAIKHREFAFASGEMSSQAFTAFLTESLAVCERNAIDGSIHFVCMDWRHVGELTAAGTSGFTELKNLCVRVKSNAGQGSFYRSQQELVFAFKKGEGAHVNNFGLGQSGRSRSNVWHYAGINSFRAGRLDELKMHPTVKPVALVADAIRDSDAGSVPRVPAHDIETKIVAEPRCVLGDGHDLADDLIASRLDRAILSTAGIELHVRRTESDVESIAVRWSAPRHRQRRSIGVPDAKAGAEYIRSTERARLLSGIAKARSWLLRLVSGEAVALIDIAQGEGGSERSVRMTLSLAFLPPVIVRAAIEGIMPRGQAITWLAEPDLAWQQEVGVTATQA